MAGGTTGGRNTQGLRPTPIPVEQQLPWRLLFTIDAGACPLRRAGMRPLPPTELLQCHVERFEPAPDVADWLRETILDEDGGLHNVDHLHLTAAAIRVLWTNCRNEKAGRRIVGQAETGTPRGSKWGKARTAQQLVEWFGSVPDFLITLDARYAAECGDAEFCALVEHELYHCAQERDQYGMPKFHRDGSPVFTMRGHDVEEFVGVVRRYGADASGVRELVEAAKGRPEVAAASVAEACGTRLLRAA